MGARKNSTKPQQSFHISRSEPEVEDGGRPVTSHKWHAEKAYTQNSQKANENDSAE